MTEFHDFIAMVTSGAINWRPCRGCGREIAADALCRDCELARDRKADLELASREAIDSIPKRYEWVTPDHATLADILGTSPAAVVAQVRGLLGGPEPVVTIQGPKEAGKTCLAVAMLRAKPEGGLFVSSDELAMSGPQHALGEGVAWLERRATHAQLLVLDELRDPGLQPARAVLERVIWARFAAERKTVVTTGLGPEALVKLFGEGIEHRLFSKAKSVQLRPRKGAR